MKREHTSPTYLLKCRVDLARASAGLPLRRLWKPLGRSLFSRRNVQRFRSSSWLVDVGACISLARKMIRHVILDNGGFSTVEESPTRKPMFNTWENIWDI